MKKNYIYACVEELIEKYNTSDPFELMDALDIHCESSNLEHLKGYCVIIHGISLSRSMRICALQSAKSSRRMSWVILFFIQIN